MDKLIELINELVDHVNQLIVRVDELTVQVKKLTGALGELRDEVNEWKVIDSLKGILKKFGFDIFASPWKPFDAYIVGDGFLALVEICVKCDEGDIDQVRRAIGAVVDKLGSKPNALIVFSLEKPEESIIEYGKN